MLFSQAIAGLGLLARSGGDVEVSRVVHDSRRVGAETIFIAMHGDAADGNRFIADTVSRGAAAVVTDSADVFAHLQVTNPGLAIALCSHGRRAMAGIAANLHGHPETKLKITGVTGTNGKTTTTFLLEAMLTAAGRTTGLLGTIENHLCGQILPALHTTPEPDDLYEFLAECAADGVSEVVMEASSHALHRGRVWGIRYDVAVFTNLTQDHLDYHGTMEAYWAAKRSLFTGEATGAGAPRVAVVNIGDAAGRELAAELRGSNVTDVVTYRKEACHPERSEGSAIADCFARDLRLSPTGSRFTLVTPHGEVEIRTNLAGRVNVLNILAAAAAAQARGLQLEQIAAGVAQLKSVPGRFEQVNAGQDFAVVVDYAHTEDALRNLTVMARELVAAHGGRVITLFGCGGDRDKTKRPLMAAAAGESSDLVVLTSDNPRSEDPRGIFRDVEAGFPAGCCYFMIENRAEAISEAISRARKGDIVLLAGKGHEKTQTMRDGVRPFDDAEVAHRALEALPA